MWRTWPCAVDASGSILFPAIYAREIPTTPLFGSSSCIHFLRRNWKRSCRNIPTPSGWSGYRRNRWIWARGTICVRICDCWWRIAWPCTMWEDLKAPARRKALRLSIGSINSPWSSKRSISTSKPRRRAWWRKADKKLSLAKVGLLVRLTGMLKPSQGSLKRG